MDCLLDVQSWDFLCEVEYEVAHGDHLYELALYEQWCDDLTSSTSVWTTPPVQCPRIFFRERIVLHAYSGRRRPGDFQWYMEQLAVLPQHQELLILSVDLVIDSTWGDIGNVQTQEFWLTAIKNGWVLGMLSGPPCCTWSIARGKDHSSLLGRSRSAPRVIRTAEGLWGMTSVSLREFLQLHDGHVLLGFSLLAMLYLHTSGGVGVLEHPAEPGDPSAASIWRLPLLKLLLALCGFEYRECAQGLLGAASAKRTGLLVLNMPDLPLFIRDNALCAELPRAQTLGVDSQGQFRTAKLKEYPPAFCRAFAAGFLHSFPLFRWRTFSLSRPIFFRAVDHSIVQTWETPLAPISPVETRRSSGMDL